MPAIDAAHDFAHITRVAVQTLKIYTAEVFIRDEREPSSQETENCLIAGLLHDCVPVAKNSPLRKESSRLSSEQAREWLCGFSPVRIDLIADAILDHSYSSGRTPKSLLGEALRDADRLEALGAIGLYRVIATGVSMNAQLFDPADPWAERRPLDDIKYSVDHFYTKLLKLPETFRTEAARIEAKKRADYLQGFLDQLKHEIG